MRAIKRPATASSTARRPEKDGCDATTLARERARMSIDGADAAPCGAMEVKESKGKQNTKESRVDFVKTMRI